MKTLEGRVAVVTGAASGIGLSTSEHLAAAGCDLALVDVDRDGAARTASAIERLGRRASVHAVDVADIEQMRRLPEAVIREHGAAHILVNNAGVVVARSFEDHTLDDLGWIVSINFWGVVYGCHFFLPHLRQHDEAHVVNLSSMAGFVGLPMQTSYCATKFAVRGFSESLQAELAGSSVGVTTVFPGATRTNVLRSSRHSNEEQMATLTRLMARYTRRPDAVASRIVAAIRRDRARVIVGAEAHATEWLQRLAPAVPGLLLGFGFDKLGPKSR